MQMLSHRFHSHATNAFTARTYELVEAWVAETGRGELLETAFVGDASAIVLASDVLIERGTLSWDECGIDVVRHVRAMGFGCMSRAFGDALVAFRRWLAEKGHAGTEGIEALEEHVRELVDEPAEVLTLRSRPPSSHDDGPRNRQERRAQASYERQRARRARRRA